MRAYVITTSVVFGVITGLHIWRAIAEGPALLKQPWFLALTLAGFGLFVWGVRLWRRKA